MPNFGFDGTVNLYDVQWNDSEEWAFIKYNIWSGGVDGVSIISLDGSTYRELTTCGFSPACIGWLPSSVIISNLELDGEQVP
jgi:hypothetical protein